MTKGTPVNVGSPTSLAPRTSTSRFGVWGRWAALALLLAGCTEPPAPSVPATPAPPVLTSPTASRPAPPDALTATPAAPSAPAAPAPSPLFAHGVASGDMTADSAVIWTRLPAAAMVTPELSERAGFEQATALTPVAADASHDFTVKATARNLKPGTVYHYRFRAGDEISPAGSFTTAFAPQQNAKVTLGFTGDADWKWKPYPILRSVAAETLDFFVFLGDLIYETTNQQGTAVAEDLEGYRAKYRENREPRAGSSSTATPMLDLYRRFGQYSVFDNHELGLSRRDRSAPPYTEGGAPAPGGFVNQTPGFRQRIQAYAEYQPVREETITGTGDPRTDTTGKFFRSVPWGANAELIVLDARSYRDARLANSDAPAAASCARTMLGAPQLRWTQDALLAAHTRGAVWKVVVTASPMQETGRASDLGGDVEGSKSWAGGYACERSKLLKFIDDNAITNVVFLTTDNHYTMINNLRYRSDPADPASPLKPARNAFEVLTGPLGAGTGILSGINVDLSNASVREGDRRIVGVWNGDLPNAAGVTRGLKQSGLDPIGLEPDFPGLAAASVRAAGVPPGSVEPLAFVSFNSFTYAVLTLDHSTLTIQVKGFPAVAPARLQDAAGLAEYEQREAQEILRFQVNAQ